MNAFGERKKNIWEETKIAQETTFFNFQLIFLCQFGGKDIADFTQA